MYGCISGLGNINDRRGKIKIVDNIRGPHCTAVNPKVIKLPFKNVCMFLHLINQQVQ